jgi:hypothetical protein
MKEKSYYRKEFVDWLTQIEALLIFCYTDNDHLYKGVNKLMRSWEKQTRRQKKLINTLTSWLNKMPNYEFRHVLRWDDDISFVAKPKNTKILDAPQTISSKVLSNIEISEEIKKGNLEWIKKWDKIVLDTYTCVWWRIEDIFLNWPWKNDTLIEFKGGTDKIKDISLVSMYKHFWDFFPFAKNTESEWIVMPWTVVTFKWMRKINRPEIKGKKQSFLYVVVEVIN